MIKEEILILKGQLVELKKKHHQLDSEGSALIKSMRRGLFLAEQDKTRLSIDEISASTDRLKYIEKELKDTEMKIKLIEEELNYE